jgi:hypothetical protein
LQYDNTTPIQGSKKKGGHGDPTYVLINRRPSPAVSMFNRIPQPQAIFQLVESFGRIKMMRPANRICNLKDLGRGTWDLQYLKTNALTNSCTNELMH